MRFGTFHLFQHPEHLSEHAVFTRTLDQIRYAEQLGYDSVWLGEHHFSRYGLVGDPLLFAAAVATATTRVRIGTAVSVLPLHHPARFAESAAVVDHLSGGRLDIGVGSGYAAIEFEGMGVPQHEAKARFNETLDFVLKLWTNASVDEQGTFSGFDRVGTNPRPLQQPHPPVYVASISPASVAAVAHRRLPLLSSVLVYPWRDTLAHRDIYVRARDAQGDSVAEIASALSDWGLLRLMYVAATDEQAWAEVRGPLLWYQRMLRKLWEPRDWSRLDPQVAQQVRASLEQKGEVDLAFLRNEVMIVGSPATALARVQEMADAGVGQLLAFMDFGGQDQDRVLRSMQLLRHEVVPAIRSPDAEAVVERVLAMSGDASANSTAVVTR